MRTALIFPLLLLGAMARPALAQTPEQDVMAVVHRLFDGMRKGDSAMVRSVFDSSVRFLSVSERDGVPTAAARSVDAFVAAVGKPHEQVYDERIWDPEIEVDSGLAAVWTKYAFYLGDTFSHCGVDVFGLVQRPGGWRIVYLADTERHTGCWRGPGS
jgi:Putative lumazine-binding